MRGVLALLASLVATACVGRGEVLREGGDTPVVLQQTEARLATGDEHACAVISSALWCWGKSAEGELGPPLDGAHGPRRIEIGAPVRAPAAGGSHTCALDTQGRVYCFGANTSGQVGAGANAADDVPTPTQVLLPAAAIDVRTQVDHTCAVLSDASLWCWGENEEGQLGQGDTHPGKDHPEPIRVGLQNDWVAVSTGQGHSCGIRAPGALYCWGRNTQFQIGQGSAEPQQYRAPQRVGSDTDWAEVSAGQNNSCARKRNGSMYCWGDIASGTLAVGDALPRSTPTLVPNITDWLSVSTNTFHTCGLRRTGEVWCAGRNTEGQLTGTNQVDAVPSMQRLGADTDWVEVRAGRFFTCARKLDDSVWCAGANTEGQVSSDPETDRSDTLQRIAL